MRQEKTKKLYEYWNNLRGNRSAPDRREIEPSDIRDILGDTFILELDHVYNTLSFRLAGTRLCNSYGRELKGIGFLTLWEENSNIDIYRLVRNVFQQSIPCVIAHIAQTEQKRFADYEMLLLPLMNGEESASRILGVATPLSQPTWLGSDPIMENRLKSGRFLTPELQTAGTVQSPNLDPAEVMEKHAARKIGHLTIIDGGIDNNTPS